MNHFLRKSEKEITNKDGYFSTYLFIVKFHEVAINYELELETQLIFLDIPANHNMGLPSSIHLKFCQMVYLLNMLIML